MLIEVGELPFGKKDVQGLMHISDWLPNFILVVDQDKHQSWKLTSIQDWNLLERWAIIGLSHRSKQGNFLGLKLWYFLTHQFKDVFVVL